MSPPYAKDYDAIPGNHPSDWPTRFAIERARCLGAYLAGRRVGGAVVIVEPNDVASLGCDPQLALLWDLRVGPEHRGRGIGRELLAAAEGTARASGARGLAVETQDVNVAACHLYAVAGYAISEIDANAYPELPDEIRLLWTKSFARPTPMINAAADERYDEGSPLHGVGSASTLVKRLCRGEDRCPPIFNRAHSPM